MVARRIRVIGVVAGYGAGDPACQDGAEVLRALRFLDDLESINDGLAWDPPLPVDPVDAVQGIARRLAQRVAGHLAQGDFPLVIGGDHSCAIGTWSALKGALESGQRMGLIWIDAHMDSHTRPAAPAATCMACRWPACSATAMCA